MKDEYGPEIILGMSTETHVLEVTVVIDFAAWRAEYQTDETNGEILRAIQEHLLYASTGEGSRVVEVATRAAVTDTDRLRFIMRRLFGATDMDVRIWGGSQ